MARKPHGGAILSAGGPAEAEIPPQSQTVPHEIRPKCLKEERDLNITHRWLLNTEIVIESLFKDAKEALKSKIN